ncbi:hypothetical protein [Aeromonas sp. 600584]|uniref:hypothetical protein n=1 Tax=unclassified Aeromonas TaxID=257493 RepID=UPI003BA21522
MQDGIPINNLQSLFQLFTAIYFIAEWVSVDRIVNYYKKRHAQNFRFKIKGRKRYSHYLNELFDGYEEDAWFPFSISHPMEKVNAAKRFCLFFSVICFIGLVLSSMNTGWIFSQIIFSLVVLFLLTPIFFTVFKVIIPLEIDYAKTVSSIDNTLREVDFQIKKYMEKHPEPPQWFTFDPSSQDEQAQQFKKYMRNKREYFSELEKYMKECKI